MAKGKGYGPEDMTATGSLRSEHPAPEEVKRTLYVLALDHTPALVVLATEDEDIAFRTAVKYCVGQDSRVVVTTAIHGNVVSKEDAQKAHAKYLADDELKRAAMRAEAEENERKVRALLEIHPAVGTTPAS